MMNIFGLIPELNIETIYLALAGYLELSTRTNLMISVGSPYPFFALITPKSNTHVYSIPKD